MNKNVYLKVSKAKLIKKVGDVPIYQYRGKFYVGFETLYLCGEKTENCVKRNSLSEAEDEAKEINEWVPETAPVVVYEGEEFELR